MPDSGLHSGSGWQVLDTDFGSGSDPHSYNKHLVGSLVVQPDPVAEQLVEQGSKLRDSEQTDKHRQDDPNSHS